MKNKLPIILLFITTVLYAQKQGDIAFIGYNADGDDDFSIVALTDIPAHSTFYFTDSKPNEDGTGMNDEGEGVITWETGEAIINKGTIIVFSNIDNENNPDYGVSVGSIARTDAGFNLSTGTDGDEIFATIGNPATNEVSVWLAGIEVHDNGRPQHFEKTKLTEGLNYLVIDETQSKDGGQYTGVRANKTIDELRTLIHDEEQWTTHTADGELALPFNNSDFVFKNLSSKHHQTEKVKFCITEMQIVVNIGKIVKVHNMLGKEVKNYNLRHGVYFVSVKKDHKVSKYKLSI